MSTNSYDFSNDIRDVSTIFDTLIANSPSFLKLLGSSGTTLNTLGEKVVTNTKYEWVNDPMTQFSSDITGFDTDGDGTGISFTSTSGLEAGSILRFEAATGASISEQVQVVSVDSATDVTVTRDYGGTTGVTLVVGDVYILNSTPRNEDSDVGSAIKHESVLDFNYTEIIDEVANLSRTAMSTSSYDNATKMATQLRAAMIRYARKVENAVLHGVKVQRTSSVAGTMGGLIQQVSAAGGNINSTGGNLSEDHINDVIAEISIKGGMLTNPALVMGIAQSRRLSALNTAGTNPTVFKDVTDRTLGGYTTQFVGDLPIDDRGTLAKVFVAQNMIKDAVVVADMDKVSLKVMDGLITKDATTPGTDGLKQRLISEMTLEVKNATSAHGIITGLNI